MIYEIPNFSQKLEEYLRKVRTATRRDIILNPVESLGMTGMYFGYRIGTENINIDCVLPYPGSEEQFEQSIAHEATHGLIVFARGFLELNPILPLSQVERNTCSIIATMVDDVPVNKILEEEGFRPLAENYFHMVDRETKAVRRHQHAIDQKAGPVDVIQRRYMIYRYVSAWTNNHYYFIKLFEKEKLNRFRKAFQRSYPQEAAEGNKIQELFRLHDVLSPEGHRVIVQELLTMWNLKEKVELKSLQRPGES